MPIPRTLRTAIFDLDGTLTDPQSGMLDCLQAALRAHDVAWDGPLTWFIGPPAGESLERLMPGSEPAYRNQVLRHYRACYAESGWCRNSVYPGVHELLGELRSRGVALYLCTSKLASFAHRILEHFALAPYFAGVAADAGTSAHHDKADLLRGLIAEHHFDPQAAVMIGDRKFDILAARAAGVASIAVTYGYGSLEELTAARPDATCDGVDAVAGLLLGRVPVVQPGCPAGQSVCR